MKELLDALKELAQDHIDAVTKISTLPELENMFVIELDNGKKYALTLLELD